MSAFPPCPICAKPVEEVEFARFDHQEEWSAAAIRRVRYAKDTARPCGDELTFEQYMSLWEWRP